MKTKSTVVLPQDSQSFDIHNNNSQLVAVATNGSGGVATPAGANAFGSGLQPACSIEDAEETLDLDTDKKRYFGVQEDGNPILVKTDSLSQSM